MHEQAQSAAELLALADSSFQQKDPQKALGQYAEAVKAARAEFNRPVEVEALCQMARMNLTQGRAEEGRPYLEEAAKKAVDSDPLGWSRYLGVKGRFEWKDSNLVAARKTFEDCYNFCALHNLWGRVVDAANMCAIVAESPEDAIQWSRRGIEMAESYENESWLGPLWNNLAGTYYDLQQFDSALECYQKARHYHWLYSDERAKLVADYHVGMTYRLVGQAEEAKKWLRPVLAWAERLEDHAIIAQALDDLGEIAFAEGRGKEAKELLTRAKDEYRVAGYEEAAPEIWKNITERLARVGK